MKHSFFLVIPKQQNNPQRLKEFEVKTLEQWIAELPTANPLLASRLVYDYIQEFNALKMPAQLRLDTLELLRPSFLAIEDYLRSKLTESDFPKEESDKKTLRLLASLEKQFTLSYWIALKEVTRNVVGWFQGKSAALAIQRSIIGLSDIMISYSIMGMQIPDWIWMDLHSLYKLSVKIKKNTAQVPLNDSNRISKTCSPEECYLQIILFSLADSTGLMQREIKLLLDFIETNCSLVSLKNEPVSKQPLQCIILTDEDKAPYFQAETEGKSDSAKLYLDFSKLYKAFEQNSFLVSEADARFSTMHALTHAAEKLSAELLDYLKQRWSGVPLLSAELFNDRLDRYLAIGFTSTYKLQKPDAEHEHQPEFLVHSVSNRLLSNTFKQTGILSVGSLVSFRKTDTPEQNRTLGVIDKLVVEKEAGKINFGVQLLTRFSISVNYLSLNATKELPKNALFYTSKEKEGKSYIIVDTFLMKEGDVVRLFIDHEDFPILLNNKKNIALGYWLFECHKIAEKR